MLLPLLNLTSELLDLLSIASLFFYFCRIFHESLQTQVLALNLCFISLFYCSYQLTNIIRKQLFVTIKDIYIIIQTKSFYTSFPSMSSAADEKKKKGQNLDQSINQGQENQNDNEQDNQLESKRRERGDWFQQDGSQVHKVLINNKRKQKHLEVDSAYEGIFLYKPGMELPSLFHFANQTIKVIIAAEYIKKTNPEVLKRNVYGAETYTSNSDCVCIAIHAGLVSFNNFQNKKYQGCQITFKVIKPKKNYIGTSKNGITSRTIKGYNGNALKPESIKMLTSLGSIESLQKYASNMHVPIGKSRLRAKPRNTSSIIPIPETHIVFNMNNEPAFKYSILNLADKGYEKNQFIKRKLDYQVLYIESQNNQKYQICRALALEGENSDLCRFSKVKNPFQFDNEYFDTGHVPLDTKDVDIIFPFLEWNQIVWGNKSMRVKDFVIDSLTSFKYYKKSGK